MVQSSFHPRISQLVMPRWAACGKGWQPHLVCLGLSIPMLVSLTLNSSGKLQLIIVPVCGFAKDAAYP